MPGEVEAAPVPPAEEREVGRAGVVRDDHQPAAGREQPGDVPHRRRGVGQVFDSHHHQDQVERRHGQRDVFDVAEVDRQPGRLRRGDRPRVGIDALEPPARPAVVAENAEVEAVAAADIEHAGVGRQPAAPAQQSPGFEPPADAVDQPELGRAELESVVVVRVDPAPLGRRRPGVEVDQPAAAAAHGEELIGTGAVLEVGPDGDRLRVLDAAEATDGRHEFQRRSLIDGGAVRRR